MTNPETPAGEQKPTEFVTTMTPERIVTVAMGTTNAEVLYKLRLELIRRSANVPEGTRDILLEQAYEIVNDRYSDFSSEQTTPDSSQTT